MTAVRSQELHQLPHRFEVGTVAQKPAFARLSDQAAVMQFFQVERQCIARNGQCIGDLSGIKAFISGAHEQTKYAQARYLRQRRQCFYKTGLIGKSRFGGHVAASIAAGRASGRRSVISQQMNSISADPVSAYISPPHW